MLCLPHVLALAQPTEAAVRVPNQKEARRSVGVAMTERLVGWPHAWYEEARTVQLQEFVEKWRWFLKDPRFHAAFEADACATVAALQDKLAPMTCGHPAIMLTTASCEHESDECSVCKIEHDEEHHQNVLADISDALFDVGKGHIVWMKDGKSLATHVNALQTEVERLKECRDGLGAAGKRIVDLETENAALRRVVEQSIEQCAKIADERAALWRGHGGTALASPHNHLTVEGECDVIGAAIRRLALTRPASPVDPDTVPDEACQECYGITFRENWNPCDLHKPAGPPERCPQCGVTRSEAHVTGCTVPGLSNPPEGVIP